MPAVDNQITKRPKLLTLFCLIALAYNGLLTLVFFFGILMSLGLGNTMMTYAELYELSGTKILLVSISGFLLFCISFWGVLKIYRLQILGLYIYLITGILLIILQLTQGFINWYYFGVFLFFSLFFSLHIRRFYQGKRNRPASLPEE
jgi:hypothetical protein